MLLHRAQDWEEHAARHVTLEDELKAIRAVVARWRGVEVRRWPSLIQGVEERSVGSDVLESFLRLRELVPTTRNGVPAWLRKRFQAEVHRQYSDHLPVYCMLS